MAGVSPRHRPPLPAARAAASREATESDWLQVRLFRVGRAAHPPDRAGKSGLLGRISPRLVRFFIEKAQAQGRTEAASMNLPIGRAN